MRNSIKTSLRKFEINKIRLRTLIFIVILVLIFYSLLILSKGIDTNYFKDIQSKEDLFFLLNKLCFGAISFINIVVLNYILSSMYSKEYENGMEQIIKSTKNKKLLKNIKFGLGIRITLLYCFYIVFLNFIISLSFSFALKFNVNLKVVLIASIMQFFSNISAASIVLLISNLSKNNLTSIIVSGIVLFAPIMLPNSLILKYQFIFPVLSSNVGNYDVINYRTIFIVTLTSIIYLIVSRKLVDTIEV